MYGQQNEQINNTKTASQAFKKCSEIGVSPAWILYLLYLRFQLILPRLTAALFRARSVISVNRLENYETDNIVISLRRMVVYCDVSSIVLNVKTVSFWIYLFLLNKKNNRCKLFYTLAFCTKFKNTY